MNRGKKRRAERELALQVLYGLSFTPANSREEMRLAFLLSPHNAGTGTGQDVSRYAFTLVEGVWSASAKLDAAIARYARNWRVDRMGRVELTLLRLAVYELFFRQDVPPKVAINEALELSRQFGGEQAKSFINGILDAAAKAAESGEFLLSGAQCDNL
ncbi:transcription antitermination factor NusB [Candidatus Desulfovibrio trichonymphae]|uniref:Transcription antitermination protein NusB n=1 Tax=Candidatus Desulfovibrio trichonymphae TaxID=1725232 RepID=A0A1J1DWW1_9BACT|nr:transcription antitermination factor NusB [Candidatus Desulfovibrio trichonymphae]BAV92348.1 transcription antitermination factor NusB [Candidatus Desulfovibrio trichonymphae]GHU90736.1 N utilization substance protein B [Deltaproteobacteria bacterium]GHU96241.1 N utilization substance protein B [Deltaproteobacteria bacterium]GHU98026.1 N utilization substance protein B [Deltaproteobacteria bacterium]